MFGNYRCASYSHITRVDSKLALSFFLKHVNVIGMNTEQMEVVSRFLKQGSGHEQTTARPAGSIGYSII